MIKRTVLTPLVAVKAPNAADLGGDIMAGLKEGVRPEPTQPPAASALGGWRPREHRMAPLSGKASWP
ncbi:hypothetical protein SBD_0584 [Streptomyces bottropensis ATCC 25435]|uniref:Uncharacterized protein n=1 Tax=Streptomyces bottropensis ATCC 25435 TaxID=1054862 RepID=M3DLU6_9ACTN|nr:hypothetical protein SBD_0584 [Streptomyces bottropensis ATCC 25435]